MRMYDAEGVVNLWQAKDNGLVDKTPEYSSR